MSNNKYIIGDAKDIKAAMVKGETWQDGWDIIKATPSAVLQHFVSSVEDYLNFASLDMRTEFYLKLAMDELNRRTLHWTKDEVETA